MSPKITCHRLQWAQNGEIGVLTIRVHLTCLSLSNAVFIYLSRGGYYGAKLFHHMTVNITLERYYMSYWVPEADPAPTIELATSTMLQVNSRFITV